MIRINLLEDHARNMIKFSQTKNAFSDSLRNSIMEAKGAKFRLRNFFPPNFINNYPEIKGLLRTGGKK